MDVFQKIKKAIIGEDPEVRNHPYLTAQELLDDIFAIFQERLKEETTSEFLLFPTCFYIYLHQADYDKRKEAFGHTVKGVVNLFHKDIRKKMTTYPDYIPHATHWRIQFLLFREGMIVEDDGNEIKAKQKEPFIISTIYSTNFSEGYFGSENFVMTTRNRASLTKVNYNVNRDALMGIEQEGNCFTVKFDQSFAKITNDIYSDNKSQNSADRAKAVLVITGGKFLGVDDGKDKYFMTSNELHISGKNDNRTSVTILNIDSDRVLNPHVLIKYFTDDDGFKLAAFGPVRCNEIKTPVSAGDRIVWVNLYNNSDIFINDEININFTTNKKR